MSNLRVKHKLTVKKEGSALQISGHIEKLGPLYSELNEVLRNAPCFSFGRMNRKQHFYLTIRLKRNSNPCESLFDDIPKDKITQVVDIVFRHTRYKLKKV